MKTFRIITSAVLIMAIVMTMHFALAQPQGIKRNDLSKNDVSVPGREVIQVLVEFAPGALAARHSHPGEEIVYVVEGALEYQLDGKPPVVIKAGEVLFIPNGVVHAVKNVGTGKAAELATYIVEKGKPLIAEVK